VAERKKTREILPELGPGVTYYKLISALRSGKISPPPAKDCSGDFAWTEADVERARQALARDLRKERGTRQAVAQ
jgi:hypothetical protein